MMDWIKIASVTMFLAVALGAFGSHALKEKLSERHKGFYDTAVFYHFIHGLGLFAVAWLTTINSNPMINWAGLFLLLGIVLFSGSLYVLTMTKVSKLGYITPFGGLAFLIGWGLLIFI